MNKSAAKGAVLLSALLWLTIVAAAAAAATPTPTSQATKTPSASATPSSTPTPTPSPTPVASATTTAAVTPTPGASASASPGGSASASRTPGPTPTPSFYTSVAVYVSNAGYSSILTFPAHGAGNAPPKILSGPLTGLQDPVGIFVNAFKDIFVVNTVAGTVLEFSPGKSGNAKPIATITGTNTGLDLPDDVALDGVGNIYVTNSGQVVDSVTEYAPESNGNVLPIATISGAQTGLAGPTGIVIDRKGVIYVANSSASSITEYAAAPATPLQPRPSRGATPGCWDRWASRWTRLATYTWRTTLPTA